MVSSCDDEFWNIGHQKAGGVPTDDNVGCKLNVRDSKDMRGSVLSAVACFFCRQDNA